MIGFEKNVQFRHLDINKNKFATKVTLNDQKGCQNSSHKQIDGDQQHVTYSDVALLSQSALYVKNTSISRRAKTTNSFD